jgi:hypothetical protein
MGPAALQGLVAARQWLTVACFAGGMTKTSGDDLFERYLMEHGYDAGTHEPDLSSYGIKERPDFLPQLGCKRIACEVEQFKAGASALERRLTSQRTVSASAKDVYDRYGATSRTRRASSSPCEYSACHS